MKINYFKEIRNKTFIISDEGNYISIEILLKIF